jgi:hypothetical protein
VDPLSLAAAAVGLLVPLFKPTADKLAERAGDAIADTALPKVKALYNRVRAKLAPGSYQGVLLDGVQAEPDDAGRQEILKAELAKLIAQDKEFAADLERLVEEAERAGGVQITATDAGVVTGRDANLRGRYVSGRDMSIGGTPDDKR